MKILFKDKNCIIISKPAGIPAQSDLSNDDDAMSLTKRELDLIGENSNLWLVHRLDRVVGGLMVFARNKESAASLSEIVGGKGMIKEYLAVVEGSAIGGVLNDYIYKDSKKGKAFVADTLRKGAKEAVLEYGKLAEISTDRGALSLVNIKLHTGRFHQIRVQFASRKMPISGDGKYGSHDNRSKMPALFASRLLFNIGNDTVEAMDIPNIDIYPWSLFKEYIK